MSTAASASSSTPASMSSLDPPAVTVTVSEDTSSTGTTTAATVTTTSSSPPAPSPSSSSMPTQTPTTPTAATSQSSVNAVASGSASRSPPAYTYSLPPDEEEQRPQAGPLPTKRGEIGYREDAVTIAAPEPAVVMPERHPADRDGAPSTSTPVAAAGGSTTPTTATTAPASASDATADDASSTNDSVRRNKRLLGFLSKKNVRGIHLSTLLLFVLQMSFICLTIVGWALAIIMLTKGSLSGHSPPPPNPGDNNGNGNDNGNGNGNDNGNNSTIFVHVIFAILLLSQLLFLERRVFRMRAERYAHVHPGEMLPTSRYYGNRSGNLITDPFIALSPWNRPPLPTYAAALAQSGAGTGDVEDHMIAVVPPPAYGNTRGSTFVLAGFLRDSLRAQRPISVHSAHSQAPPRVQGLGGDWEMVDGNPRSRPASYVTVDEQWEVIQDADRARRLEETLETLEGGTGPGPSVSATNTSTSTTTSNSTTENSSSSASAST